MQLTKSGKEVVYLGDDPDEPLGPDLPEEESIPDEMDALPEGESRQSSGVVRAPAQGSQPEGDTVFYPDLSTVRTHSNVYLCSSYPSFYPGYATGRNRSGMPNST